MNTHKKEVFAENWSVFLPKLGDELGLFCLIMQHSNLDGVQLNLDGRTLNLDGGTLTPDRGTLPPASPLQFKYWG